MWLAGAVSIEAATIATAKLIRPPVIVCNGEIAEYITVTNGEPAAYIAFELCDPEELITITNDQEWTC
jgi:hypothetical protein